MPSLTGNGLQWISTGSSEQAALDELAGSDGRTSPAPAPAPEPPKIFRRSLAHWLFYGTAISGFIYLIKVIRDPGDLGKLGGLALAILAFTLFVYLTRRTLTYAKTKMNGNQGREILIGKEALWLSAGELARNQQNADYFLTNNVLNDCRKFKADYLCFRYAECKSFFVESGTLTIFPKDSAQDKFAFESFPSTLNAVPDAFVDELAKRLPNRKGEFKAHATQEFKVGVAFAVFLLAVLIWNAIRQIWIH